MSKDQFATAEERYNMVSTCCPNCGESWNIHNPNTGECPEKQEYEPEELAAIAIACYGADGAHIRIALLLNNADTLRRLHRMEN
jgi:hypothetical protein